MKLGLFYKEKKVGKGWEKEKINIIVPFRSYTTSNRKFEKNGKKIQKIKKYHYGYISKQYRQGKAEKERK